MRKLFFLIILTSCGPVYLPMGFILPPSGIDTDGGQLGGAMYFYGGGYNPGDRAWGVSLHYTKVVSGPYYGLRMGLSAYGGDYYASSYGRSYSFSGVYGFMEPDLRLKLLPYLSLNTGIYGGLGSEMGSYITSVVSDDGYAVPVFRFAYTAGLDVGKKARISARLYLGLPTALVLGVTGMGRWSVFGGVSHSDSGTVFLGISRKF